MSPFPQMAEALWDTTEPVEFTVLGKTNKDFELVETVKNKIIFQGNLQPQPPTKILLKPEGQRTWKWWTMWAKANLDLDWVFTDAAKRQFRVMTKSDWGRAGFYEYELTETAVPA